MGAYAAGAGLVLGGIGSIFGANSARTKKNQLTDLANTPGLNIDQEVSQALNDYQQNLPGASQLAGGINQSNSAQMRQLLSSGIPGYEGLQAQDLSNIGSELRGELPPDVQSAIERATAAHAIGGGYGGSQAARNLTARDLGLTSLNLTQQGGAGLARTMQTTPLPGLIGAQNFLGPSISDRIGIRSNERTQKLAMMSNAIGAPSSLDVISQYLEKTGGSLMGAGAGTLGTGAFDSFTTGRQPNNGLNTVQGGANYSSQFGGGY